MDRVNNNFGVEVVATAPLAWGIPYSFQHLLLASSWDPVVIAAMTILAQVELVDRHILVLLLLVIVVVEVVADPAVLASVDVEERDRNKMAVWAWTIASVVVAWGEAPADT